MIKIAISGAGGRMGRRIAALAIESEQFDIVAGLESPSHEAVGKDIGELAGLGHFGVKVSATLAVHADVLIDFSSPPGTLAWLGACRKGRTAMVIGTTGLTDSQRAEVADAAGQIAIVHSANMSVGVNVLMKLVAAAAAALGEDYDVEITETHHRFKEDAPSGTAIGLARVICQTLGKEYGDTVILGRGGRSPRPSGEIGIHSLRVGDTVGEHAVHFGNLGETVTLAHSAHTRDTFAFGALRAAAWLVGRKPGLYTMTDVLGL